MKYVVKYGKNDYRLVNSDGTVIAEFEWTNNPLDGGWKDSQLSDINENVDVEWNYRDLTLSDESVPWDS